MTDPALDRLVEAVPAGRARAFLRAYRITKTISGAAEASGCTTQAHRYWLGKHDAPPVPGYVEAFREINEEVDLYWEELAQQRAMEGSWEETYDGDGNLIRRQRKHDSSYLKAVLAGRMPERYGRAGTTQAQSISIVVVRTEE